MTLQTKSNTLFSTTEYQLSDDAKEPIIIADNIKSPENIGHIIRLASNFNCSKVFFVINTQEPTIRLSKIKKVAGAAFDQVDWSFCQLEELTRLVPSDYTICGIETTDSSLNLFEDKLPNKIALVLGNEVAGISEPLLKLCCTCYHIPMLGKIKSMNVSHALSATLSIWGQQNIV